MTGIVWISRALVHPTNQRPFRNDVAERDHDRLIEIKQANERGEVLNPDQFPTVIFGAPHALERDYQVPDDQVVVSAEALQPPDIWVDPQLWGNFFVSHDLREALRKAKLSSRFYLTRCRVAD